MTRERRRNTGPLGAHPERRILAPARREALSRAGARGRRAAVVLPPVANLYERPDGGAPVVSQAILGSPLVVLETRPAWALVETPDRYRGWARLRALRSTPSGRARRGAPERLVEIGSLMANIYREPDVTSATPIAVAPMLARLAGLGDDGEWIRVRLPDGRAGFLQSGDARPPEAAAGRPDPRAVAATALRLLGLPYLWGGTTTFGLDCSGLTQLAYRAHGFLLPRDADLQYDDGRLEAILRAEIRTGDLVFFGPETVGITHVGVSLERDTFVNATTYGSPTVRIDRLDDPYWENLYRGARRIKE